jgi:hypothetical protein
MPRRHKAKGFYRTKPVQRVEPPASRRLRKVIAIAGLVVCVCAMAVDVLAGFTVVCLACVAYGANGMLRRRISIATLALPKEYTGRAAVVAGTLVVLVYGLLALALGMALVRPEG